MREESVLLVELDESVDEWFAFFAEGSKVVECVGAFSFEEAGVVFQ